MNSVEDLVNRIGELEDVLITQDLFILDFINEENLPKEILEKYTDKYNDLSVKLGEVDIT